jgi:GT2 family glycosyltransferase
MSSSLNSELRVYCVVVAYNGSKWIRQCIASLSNSSYPLNIIVVDNNSQDDTTDIIKKDFRQVDLILLPENSGFGGANNVGIGKALDKDADFVFLLNQDAWVEPETVEKLLNALRENYQYGIVSALHYTGSGNKLDAGFYSYILRDYSKDEIAKAMLLSDSEIKQVSFINAAAWLVSRPCFERVGGFSPLFFVYGEDNDYVNRVKFHGLKLGYLSNCKIYHDRETREESASFESLDKMTRYYQTKMKVRLSDINQKFPLVLVFSFIWLIKETVFHTFWRGKFFGPLAFIRVFFYSLSITVRVYKTREKTKSGGNFLFLESRLR